MTARNIFVTGPPRCGKSTLIEKLILRIEKPMTGFFTREIKEKGRRIGFSITTLDGKKGVLAHENMKSRFRVGKYGVNLEDIDQIAVPSMLPAKPDEIVVIDEVGKMECFSLLFRQTLMKILDSDHQVIGSIAQKGDRFIQKIKARDDVLLANMSEKNRDTPELFSLLLSALHYN
ncbi:MAG: AAA family ATPase [Deltaproteobacteria bacterium]|nr:AAA family ATPase [Deltaproteobacteria bacterium]MBW2019893.1 AAA family ATPase [Deltaproteobacteria bacterium]MBW2074949.1 AAA family ATPase [Deltaproteobacteria bacterium]RLB82429.1 MAG: AAA family ATPase [Deltaproteobacteria bacterium]